jgi:hypothetical protein
VADDLRDIHLYTYCGNGYLERFSWKEHHHKSNWEAWMIFRSAMPTWISSLHDMAAQVAGQLQKRQNGGAKGLCFQKNLPTFNPVYVRSAQEQIQHQNAQVCRFLM